MTVFTSLIFLIFLCEYSEKLNRLQLLNKLLCRIHPNFRLWYFVYCYITQHELDLVSVTNQYMNRCRWSSGLRRRSAAASLLGLWVRIPLGEWMSLSCECCVLCTYRSLRLEVGLRKKERKKERKKKK